MQTIACPNCHQEMQNVPQLAGQVVACPRCRGQMVMPSILPVAPPAAPSFPSTSRVVPHRKSANYMPFIIVGCLVAIVAIVGLVLLIDELRMANAKRHFQEEQKEVEREFRKAMGDIQKADKELQKALRE